MNAPRIIGLHSETSVSEQGKTGRSSTPKKSNEQEAVTGKYTMNREVISVRQNAPMEGTT